jgi:hypothetical protein
MKSLKQTVFNYVAPLLSIFSVATAPLEIEAQCCDTSSCNIDWCSMLVPVLAGAAAGAGVAAAVTNHGKHGKHGCRGDTGATGATGAQGEPGLRGPQGQNPFIRDVTHSLSFTFIIESIQFNDNTDAPAFPIIPYVGTPDGEILSGIPIPFENTSEPQTVTITKGSPVYGNYVFGIQVPSHGLNATIIFRLLAETSDGRSDTIYPGEASPVPSFFAITLTPPPGNENVQLPSVYTYGPTGTVPQP